MVCWTQGEPGDVNTTRVRCSRAAVGGPWSLPFDIAQGSTGRVSGIQAFPSLANHGRNTALLTYEADSSGVFVTLRPDMVGSPDDTLLLARLPITLADFCPRPSLPCRNHERTFFPGDYVSLASTPGRLVAAYVIPLLENGEIAGTAVSAAVLDR